MKRVKLRKLALYTKIIYEYIIYTIYEYKKKPAKLKFFNILYKVKSVPATQALYIPLISLCLLDFLLPQASLEVE